jgi:hypothetical protein
MASGNPGNLQMDDSPHTGAPVARDQVVTHLGLSATTVSHTINICSASTLQSRLIFVAGMSSPPSCKHILKCSALRQLVPQLPETGL